MYKVELSTFSGALIVLLAFLIPSIQDQWNQFQSRRVLQRHVELGREFMREGKYKLAEESFAKAFELSENKRLDIDEERLKAKVQAVNADPDWGAKNLEGLEETEFLSQVSWYRKLPFKAPNQPGNVMTASPS